MLVALRAYMGLPEADKFNRESASCAHRTAARCRSPWVVTIDKLSIATNATSIPSRFFRGGDGPHDRNFAFQLGRIQLPSA